MIENVLLIIFTIIPLSMEGKPGTFFWKPRLAIDFAHTPVPRAKNPLHAPNQHNAKDGWVVMLNGYNVGVTAVALAQIIDQYPIYDHLNPTRAAYYTNVYRWALRHFSLYPDWLAGKGYPMTHKVWARRYFYNDRLVPNWLRTILPWVQEKDWKKEERDLVRFHRYAEPIFGKLQRYPRQRFTNFTTQEVFDTFENLDRSSNSIQLR